MPVLDRDPGDLSGGELQRFAIAIVAIRDANVYMFDEPSSYLDVKQRLKAARVIRSLLNPETYVISHAHLYWGERERERERERDYVHRRDH